MALNAFGRDFFIGAVFRSKDLREDWRHVIITDMRNGRAKCHNLLYGEPRKMTTRGSWIGLKNLATRWQTCPVADCWCKAKSHENPALLD